MNDPALIIAFNMARLDEDEKLARQLSKGGNPAIGVAGRWNAYREGGDDGWAIEDDAARKPAPGIIGNRTVAAHIARHDPARVLRQVAAGRRILARHHDDGHGYCAGCPNGEISGDPEWEIDECPENRDLAATWADNPGYQQRWAL